jgi:dienelactone hydrolase
MQNQTALKIYLLALSFGFLMAAPPKASAQDKSWQTAFGDVNELLPELREEIVKIPQTQMPANAKPGDKPIDLTATLFQPPGPGPFPVVVLSHGSPSRGADRVLLGRYRVVAQIKLLVSQGLAVLVPMRRGFGVSTDAYAESIGFCQEPRYVKTGAESVSDLRAAVAFIRSRSTLDASTIVLMGQSAGSFASIAAGSAQLPGVVAVVNLSGGRGGNGLDGIPCRPDLLAKTMGDYAKTLRVPALWFYAENDKYFGPASVKAMFEAFETAGGKGKLVMHPPYGNDGHLLFYVAEAVPIWSKAMNVFFEEVGLARLAGKP